MDTAYETGLFRDYCGDMGTSCGDDLGTHHLSSTDNAERIQTSVYRTVRIQLFQTEHRTARGVWCSQQLSEGVVQSTGF